MKYVRLAREVGGHGEGLAPKQMEEVFHASRGEDVVTGRINLCDGLGGFGPGKTTRFMSWGLVSSSLQTICRRCALGQ